MARRVSPRKRASKAQTNEVHFGGVPTWLDEALAVVVSLFGLFILASVVSVRWGPTSVHSMENLMGPLGRATGDLLYGTLGWSSMVLVAYLGGVALFFWRHGDLLPGEFQRPRILVLLGLAGLMFSTAILGASVAGQPGGGAVGVAVVATLSRGLGITGVSLLGGALLICSLAFASRRSVPSLLRSLGLTAARLAVIVFLGVPYYSWLSLKTIAKRFWAGVEWLGGRRQRVFDPPSSKRDAAERDLEQDNDAEQSVRGAASRIRRRGEEEDSEEAESDEEVENASFSPDEDEERFVVVQRRTSANDPGVRKLLKAREKTPPPVEAETEKEPYKSYVAPELSLLVQGEESVGGENDDELREMSKLIEAKLRDFGVFGHVTHVHPGPVITLFEFEPAAGVKVGRISALQDDLAMSLRATSIRIIAPIPRRGTVGIEVPNKNRDIVRLRDVLESRAFLEAESTLAVPVGKDTYGDPVVVDISTMPHLLIAGATGTGKSVCINSVLVSLLYRATPAELGLILIDPKILELSVYDGVPHLRVPVVTVPKQAKAVLEWAVNEMNRRYRYMQRFGVRNVDSYNRLIAGEDDEGNLRGIKPEDVIKLAEEQVVQSGTVVPEGAHDEAHQENLIKEELKPLPKIVIVIDELADLMLTVGRDIEEVITKLAQKARAAGIHLIVATQRPSVDVVTGLIKANFPARMSFRVSSRIDSRTILDSMGAERLLGRGDMLFMQPGAEALRRIHGAFVSDNEVKRVVEAIKSHCQPRYDQQIIDICERALLEDQQGGGGANGEETEYDEMYDRAVEFIVQRGQASTSMLQRAFRIGYNRAARLIDRMERDGVVGPMDGARPRDVLVPANPSETEIDAPRDRTRA